MKIVRVVNRIVKNKFLGEGLFAPPLNKQSLVIIGVIICTFLITCASEHRTSDLDDFSQKFGNKKLDSKVTYTNLIFNLVRTGGEGKILIEDDHFIFYDVYTRKLEKIGLNGNYETTLLRFGGGPNEIKDMWIFNSIPSVGGIVIGSGDNYLLFDEHWNRSSTWKSISGLRKPIRTNNPFDNASIYSIDYFNELQIPIITNDGNIILPITIRKYDINAYSKEKNADKYYKFSKTLALYNIDDDKIIKIFGQKPPIYNEYSYLSHLDGLFYEYSDNKIFVNYMADSTIYVYTSDGIPNYSFGFSGKRMPLKHTPIPTKEKFIENSDSLRMSSGMYLSIYHDRDRNLTFRSYWRGDGTAGLQIYYGVDLIADDDVPMWFFVRGKIGKTYYADGYRDNKEDYARVGVYKLNIRKLN